MKIVHLIMEFETGGTETMLIDIMNRQVKEADVSMIVINDIYSSALLSKIDKSVKVFLLNRKPTSRNIFKLLSLNWILFALNPNVLHFHNPAILKSIFFYGRKIVTLHSMPTNKIKIYPNFINFLNAFDSVVAISDAVKIDIIQNGLKFIDKLCVVANGIDIEKICNKSDIRLSITFKIVQVSRLDHNIKGQHILIKAIRQIVYDMGIRNVIVDFIGIGESDVYLKELVISYKLENFVNFLGFKDREYIYNNLCNYDLFVQPSLFEGFGLTVAEAMAAKIPVLVSDSDGPMEIINNGDFGYFFEKGNANDCVNQIMKIMNKPKKEINEIIEKAYSRVNNKFAINTTVKKYFKIYNSN